MKVPHHIHDCDSCEYVGTDTRNPGEPTINVVDLYIHRNPSGKISLIRRYSSSAPHYACRSVFGPKCVEQLQYLERWRIFVPHLT